MNLFKKKNEAESDIPEGLLQSRKKKKGISALIRDRRVLAAVCLILAGILAFVALPQLYQRQAKITTVVAVTGTIQKGETIKEAKIEEKEVGAYGLPANVIHHLAEVKGKTAKVDMLEGDYVTASKCGDFASDPVIKKIIKEGKRLTSITVPSHAAGVASHLQKGDVVTVGVAKEAEAGFYISMEPELQNLKIYDIENEDAVSVERVKTEQKKEDAAKAIPQTITFITTDVQAAKLLDAEYNGKLHLILTKR